jgi:hypothetical protein
MARAETYLNFLVLHLVLDGPQEDSFLSPVTNFEILGELDHGF